MNAVEYAERATLGALLLDTGQLDHVRNWLEVDDFADPRNRIVYAAILDLDGRGDPRNPGAVLAHLIADPRACRNNATGAYLAELIDAVPNHSRSALYGRMVLEASIHRAVYADAVRLEQTAEGGSIDLIQREARNDLDHLGQLDGRWLAAGGGDDYGGLTFDNLSAPQPPSGRSVLAEMGTIGALLRSPAALSDLREWLLPQDFSNPWCRALYTAMVHLEERGVPIDAVTISWQLLRSSGPVDCADHVAAVATCGMESANIAGRRVLADSILYRTMRLGRELEADAQCIDRGRGATRQRVSVPPRERC